MIRVRWAEPDGPVHDASPEQVPGLLARKGVLVWLDVTAPDDRDRQLLTGPCGFHPLAVEEAIEPRQRPRLAEFGDHFVVLLYEVDYDASRPPPAAPGRPDAPDAEERLSTCQVGIFVREDLVATVHQEPSDAARQVWDRCDHQTPLLRRGSDFLLYNLLDALVDRYFPLLDALDEQIDALEDRIVSNPTRDILDQIFTLKRALIRLRKIAGPTREALVVLTTRDFPAIHPDTLPYFRDVSDHLIRIYDILDSYRDLMSGALDAYLSTISNQLNLVMQRLTIVAVIFLPLTFITGVFGMNFHVSPWIGNWDHGQVFWTVVAVMAVIGGWLAWWFHRKRLL